VLRRAGKVFADQNTELITAITKYVSVSPFNESEQKLEGESGKIGGQQ
jgi:hypothetical protein